MCLRPRILLTGCHRPEERWAACLLGSTVKLLDPLLWFSPEHGAQGSEHPPVRVNRHRCDVPNTRLETTSASSLKRLPLPGIMEHLRGRKRACAPQGCPGAAVCMARLLTEDLAQKKPAAGVGANAQEMLTHHSFRGHHPAPP